MVVMGVMVAMMAMVVLVAEIVLVAKMANLQVKDRKFHLSFLDFLICLAHLFNLIMKQYLVSLIIFPKYIIE